MMRKKIKYFFIFGFIMFFIIFLNTNSYAIQWQAVNEVEAKSGTVLYKKETGSETVKGSISSEDVKVKSGKVDGVSKDGKRLKLKSVDASGSILSYEGYINISDVESYSVSYERIYSTYKSNPDIINELEEDELEKWKTKLKDEKAQITSSMGTSFNADLDTKRKYIDKILLQIAERKRQQNQDSVKDKTDKELEEMKQYSVAEILDYLQKSNPDDIKNIPQEILDSWEKEIEENGNERTKMQYEGLMNGKSLEEIEIEVEEEIGGGSGIGDLNESLYKKPMLNTNDTDDSSASISDMMNDGDDFIKSATNNPIKTEQLQSVSSNLYNIFVEIGVVLAVIIGLVIGIKYMYTSVDQKAEIKKLLVPYLIGCVVIFGALGIWKFVVTLLETI